MEAESQKTLKPSEADDIFIHSEGDERIAYQGGREIARMSRMGQERFYVELQRWFRKNGARQVWLIDSGGHTHLATEIIAAINQLQQERDSPRPS